MKRFVVFVAVLALLSVGFAAFADPIQVGGTSFAEKASFEVHPGQGHGHAWGHGKKDKGIDDGFQLLSSPIQVGGT